MAEQKFDLDSLLKTNYEYEPLKKVLEYLLSREKTTDDRIAKLEKELNLYSPVGITFRMRTLPKGPSMPEFKGMKDKLAKLEERVYSHDERFVQHQTLLDATSFNLQMIQMSVNDHEARLSECS